MEKKSNENFESNCKIFQIKRDFVDDVITGFKETK